MDTPIMSWSKVSQLIVTRVFLFNTFLLTGINVQDGQIYPATFLDKGPEEWIRHARIYGDVRGVSYLKSLTAY